MAVSPSGSPPTFPYQGRMISTRSSVISSEAVRKGEVELLRKHECGP